MMLTTFLFSPFDKGDFYRTTSASGLSRGKFPLKKGSSGMYILYAGGGLHY